MVGRKKKTRISDKGSQEDRISELPDALIYEILSNLSTKEAVRTSVLSNKWRNLWQWVPGLDLDSSSFKDVNVFVSFVDKCLDSHKESWIRKLRLDYDPGKDDKSFLTLWIDAVTVRRIQHLDVDTFTFYYHCHKLPRSLYTCETLVHLRLSGVSLFNAECVSLPCLKIIHLEYVRAPNDATLEKLISSSPVLEDLTIANSTAGDKVIQVRSQTLERVHIDSNIQVVVDAPLLQCLRTHMNSRKNFEIINLGFSTRLDIDACFYHTTDTSLIQDILADISRVRYLVIRNVFWKHLFLSPEPGPLLEFQNLLHLNAQFLKSDLEMLPTILESCPKLESLILELVDPWGRKMNTEPKVTFSTVPGCLGSSLKFVELKRLIKGYEGEMELVRYFLKNSAILEILRLDFYHTKKAKCAFFQELVAMPRCSSACIVRVL